jgi:hypothetical protein
MTKLKETYEVEFEMTDTFGGERNYSWVKRATVQIEVGTSSRAIMRRLKAFAGYTGLKGRSYDHGDMGEFRPWRACLVASWQVVY